jgi:hypothetical protein
MPTPNRTPASTRFDPPSPKAKVSPATTMATSESPRAMVLVKAVSRTLTAFSQGEAPPCANAGAARISATTEARTARVVRNEQRATFQCFFTSTPRPEFASQVAMRGKCTRPMRAGGRSRNALVRRHARLTPEESRPLRLDATQQQRSWSRELPSIYLFSVWEEKCVAGNAKYFEKLQRPRVVRRRGQTARVQVHRSSRSLCLEPTSVGTPCPFKSLHEPETVKNDTPSCKSRG